MPRSHFQKNISVATTEAEEVSSPQKPELCSASRISFSGKQPVHKLSLLTEASYREGNCRKCESAASWESDFAALRQIAGALP